MASKRPIRGLAETNEINTVAPDGIIRLMIALLRGVLLEKHPNQAIVETGGVGYDVTIPVSTFTHLPDPGAEVRLRVHTHVREDALSLYGFLTQDEKSLFEKLIGVSGMGLKPPDLLGAWACSNCHARIDTDKSDAVQLAFAHGVFRTQAALIREGLV